MSGYRFKLRTEPAGRLDLSGLTPGKLGKLSVADIEKLDMGLAAQGAKVADAFIVSGSAGDTITIDGGSDRLDFAGAGLESGTVVIDGTVGAHAGRKMRGGRLDSRGNAGAFLGSGLSNGIIAVMGRAGDYVGAVSSGSRFGMTGGIVVVEGDIGERAGDRMRRGTIITRGATGPCAGARMIGGTIIAEGGFGIAPGSLMRRGSLIGPRVERILDTFVDCGNHDCVIFRIMNRYYAEALGSLAPKPITGSPRKYAGDMATIGKGELLLTA